jgi:O-antigen/teichoic acid export membrane protein
MSARFIFGSSAIYAAVLVAERLASLVVMPLMTRALTPADYGVMLLVANAAGLINLVFGFGLAQALPTLFANANTDAIRRTDCTTIMASIAIVLGLCYLAIAVWSRPLAAHFVGTTDYAGAIALSALSSYLAACALCLVLLLRLSERHTLYLKVQLPVLALQTALIVSLALLGRLTLETQYVALAIAALCATICYGIALRRWLTGGFSPRHLADAGRIAGQMLPWQLAILLTTNSAAFFLIGVGALEQGGLFLIANGAASLMVAASTSVENVWTPFVLMRKDHPDLPQTQVRIFSLYSAALLAPAAALSLFAHELFVVLAGPAFREGYRFVPALCLVYVLFGFANAFAQGLQARRRTVHYAWIGMAVLAVFVALALTLTRRYGAWGIIAAMGGGSLTMLVLLQTVSARLMPVSYPWPRHGLMWLIAVAIVAYVYPLELGWNTLAIKLASFAVILTLPFLFAAVHGSDLSRAKNSLMAAIRRSP